MTASDEDLIQKGQDDLIRRGDALKLMHLAIDVYGQNMRGAADKKEKRDWQSMLISAVDIRYAIKAIPAVQVAVKPLEWETFSTECAKAFSVAGKYEVVWGFRSGQVCLDMRGMTTWHDTIGAAKAAAQADYEARIRSALTAQPSPDVTALVEAAKDALTVLEEYHMGSSSPVICDLVAALKGDTHE